MEVGTSPEFGVTTSINIGVRTVNFGYKCKILPAGLTTTVHFKKELSFEVTATDCSSALVDDKSFDPSDIAYVSIIGNVQEVMTTYLDVFTHHDEANCPVQACSVKATGCGSSFGSADLTCDSTLSPYKVLTSASIGVGTYAFCYECEVLPEGTSTTIKFTKNNLGF